MTPADPVDGAPAIPEFDAVTLDVGGVFVVPSHDRLADVLRSAGVAVDRSSFWDGHYAAMHAVDADRSDAETFDTYVEAFCHHVGLRDEAFRRAVAALDPLFGPSALWSEPIPGSLDGLRALHAAGIPLAVVSNADGAVVELLAGAGICQVGDGPSTPVAAIVDSGVVGIAKPDPRIFEAALDALGTAPARTVHVGDSVHYDVRGAAAAGMVPVHFDPRRLCRAADHAHVAALGDLLPR